jgi:ubiquinone/menaquinone biosynthesis C-methylase UbiE
MAKEYDGTFTNSRIGRAQRNAVWNVITQTFHPGDHILELNCGTGEDALFLARSGMSVTACDASEQMIRVASLRLHSEAPGSAVNFRLLPTERILELPGSCRIDGAFSNFSGLNCVADLKKTANDLAILLTAGAPLLICLSTRFCIWEMLWFIAHGDLRKAFRRCSGHTIAKVGDFAISVSYPTVRKLQDLFSPYFILRSYRGIGVLVPPSYVETWIRKRPGLLRAFIAIDQRISALHGFRTIGDHILLRFERV